MAEEKSQSPQGRRSLSSQITAMGTRLGRALSRDGGGMSRSPTERAATPETLVEGGNGLNLGYERSLSRGREGYVAPAIRNTSTSRDRDVSVPRGREHEKISIGRGGVGNIIRSPSRDVEPESRNYLSAQSPPRALSTGRGGAGNIRSASRSREPPVNPESQTASIISEHARDTEAYEREVLARAAEARENVHSTGRGGAGNIAGSRSRSRSRSKGPAFHSTGRGGAGNIAHGFGNPEEVDIEDDDERAKHSHFNGIHSTGRGGIANMTTSPGPTVEVTHHHEGTYESSGRGGAGNIRSRSQSREPAGARASSKDRITQIWNKVAHPHPHHTQDPNRIVEGQEGLKAGHD